jgi:Zn-dependent peptidase ImmA (M78 family)
MVGALPPLKARAGVIRVIERVGERALVRQVHALARRTRREIDEAGLPPDYIQGIAGHYGITLRWGRLTDTNPSCYVKDTRTIVLDPRVQGPERLQFSFGHELLHDRIEQDDDLLSLLADAYIRSDQATMERLCNAGAAEWLMPSADVQDMVRAYGFSTTTIPALCQRYHASSLAVAIHMVATASHQCYLVIAAPRDVRPDESLPRLVDVQATRARPRLVMRYTVASPSAKYTIRRGQPVPAEQLMCAAWQKGDAPISGRALIPFASGKPWKVPCDAFAFRGHVFAFFHTSDPVSQGQMRLFE